MPICNIAHALSLRAQESPERSAIHFPVGMAGERVRYRSMSYAELDARSSAIAAGLTGYGIGRGVRTVLMVRPSPELYLLMFALFKAGAVPVLVDPGISKRALSTCLAEAQPAAFVGVSLAHAARLVLGWARSSVQRSVTVGSRWFWGGATLRQIEKRGASQPSQVVETRSDELAAVLFTSGSTGIPKGVEYQHGQFAAQVELLRTGLGIVPGEINLPTFPPFALFDPALGSTSVIPLMDPTSPAHADPRKLISAIEQFSVSMMFGSPALLRTLVHFAVQQQITLPTLKMVLSAGAPVPPDLVELSYRMLKPNARLYTPYGATEVLPVALVEGRELLGAARKLSENGAGICVGTPLPQNLVRIIKIRDDAIPLWDDALLAPAGQVGEITVRGPSVTHAYFGRPQATDLAKIREGSESVHRMGDVGYFDSSGKLWYAGRKSHRVATATQTLFSEQVEAVFNQHPQIRRSALVGVGAAPQRALVLYELKAGAQAHANLATELRQRALLHPHTAELVEFLHYPRVFPVDIRHNAKIGREQLARWATQQLATR